ncbi:MAG: 50S ribosomal protein L18 [bacterium]
MNKEKIKQFQREKRHNRVRAKVFGNSEKPRLCVSRSLNGVYLQIIDDVLGKTLVSAVDKVESGNKTERAFKAGQSIAKKSQEAGIQKAVFDRGFFPYHGRIKAVADGARDGGLRF